MLLPPQELIALGGIVREFDECRVTLIDSIAENISTAQLHDRIVADLPDIIIAIQGFECFEDDIDELNKIKENFPDTTLIVFGHYSTVFHEDILKKTKVDIAIIGEPDLIFKRLLEAIISNESLANVGGIAYREQGEIKVSTGDTRIRNIDELPMPAYDLLIAEKYHEPFLKPPLGLIQSARGCPYSCNYCVRSFGKKLTYRTPEQIIEEIQYLQQKFGINSLRFIDDTFTVHPARVIDICQKMIEAGIHIDWTCLSRLDTLKEEMIPWMKKAGCKRIYFGVESASPKVLNFLNKNLDLKKSESIVRLCRANGIETLGWFIVGAPNEDEEAFQESVNYAIRADFDFISVSELTIYPGTELFEKMKDEINFSLLPYVNTWKDEERSKINHQREKEFYRRFYYRRAFMTRTFMSFVKNPLEYVQTGLKLSRYMVATTQSKRADFL
jgi:radical SAM superfamily enzyme YgiQ (UPF0313 family)